MEPRLGWRFAGTMITLLATSAMLAGCASIFGSHEKRADVQIVPAAGHTARGTVTLIEHADGVQVTYNLSGLPPDSDHALQIHERGDCHSPGAAGGVFSPGAERLKQGIRLEGDLVNLHADANGVAAGFIVSPDVSLDGVRSVVGRALIVHRDAQDYYVFPLRDAGPALGCGIIRK
ncbi:superoxide dismutase family protein [Mycetohabitans sp. B5]|uniref:Cu-Zn family superoxide dismutase n=1 Tax=Mycetohabitans endofungorum TaxID=417203 RepID=A0A2P5KE76_9BURK|nr:MULTISPECIES: superoxide dismutase family protein [Mycetohabitans]MCG1053846.1 superoxide dismutase family protein [Mycetohabitans sp. B5]PPB85011.1 Cu-Zn family superoxide dismutase [Mycetohabitans endofungorum]